MSTLASDPLVTSAETWREHGHREPAIPAELVPPPTGVGRRERVSALHRRHLLREERAKATYAASRSPERGWPVADNHVVLAFFRGLLRERRSEVFWLVALNALAAGAALVIPRLLGSLVNRTDAGGVRSTQIHQLDRLALVIVGVVCAQALLTFLAQRISTIFGQDLLSSAREYIVATVLRLPLGRVEGASTGDLVTRVTRDVGTMSRSVQFGVPQAIISGLTVALSVVAMLLNSVLLGDPVPAADRGVGLPGTPIPPARAEGLHHRGGDVLPDQHDADRDRRGCSHGRGAGPQRPARRTPAMTTSPSRRRPSATR